MPRVTRPKRGRKSSRAVHDQTIPNAAVRVVGNQRVVFHSNANIARILVEALGSQPTIPLPTIETEKLERLFRETFQSTDTAWLQRYFQRAFETLIPPPSVPPPPAGYIWNSEALIDKLTDSTVREFKSREFRFFLSAFTQLALTVVHSSMATVLEDAGEKKLAREFRLTGERLRDIEKRVSKITRRTVKLRGSGGSPPRYDLSNLDVIYKEQHPIWRRAAKLYKDHRDGNWREIIKAAYAHLPDNLIERLCKSPDLPPEQLEKLEKGGDSIASDIALEHAARLCDPSYGEYGLSLAQLERSKRGLTRKRIHSSQPLLNVPKNPSRL